MKFQSKGLASAESNRFIWSSALRFVRSRRDPQAELQPWYLAHSNRIWTAARHFRPLGGAEPDVQETLHACRRDDRAAWWTAGFVPGNISARETRQGNRSKHASCRHGLDDGGPMHNICRTVHSIVHRSQKGPRAKGVGTFHVPSTQSRHIPCAVHPKKAHSMCRPPGILAKTRSRTARRSVPAPSVGCA